MKEATIKKGEKLSDSSSSIHSPELPNIRRGGRVLSRFNKLTNGNWFLLFIKFIIIFREILSSIIFDYNMLLDK